MGQDAQLYLRRNRAKIKAAAATLLKKPSVYRRFIRFARHFSNLQGFFLPPVF